MAEPLKNIYNENFLEEFALAIQQVFPSFDKAAFLKNIFDKEWKNRELKQRMRHIVITLNVQLPKDYKQMIKIVLAISKQAEKNYLKSKQVVNVNDGFKWMFLPEFVELYGLEDYKTSIKAFEKITQFTSCEFAVRPFIVKYPKQMMTQMLVWTKHEHPMVRRLATEGCRPRLPWAMALPALKKDPKAVLLILEKLKNDTSESVRRSVANNLNDIAKDNPELVIKIAKKWIGKNSNTDKLVKHACRTLLKEGRREVMELFGFGSVENIEIVNFEIQTPQVKIGASLSFSFDINNKNTSPSLLRLEYGIYYQKANGTLSRKVFKISEKKYPNNSITSIEKKQSFKIITTRKFHLGRHQVSIIVNGKEFEQHDFELK